MARKRSNTTEDERPDMPDVSKIEHLPLGFGNIQEFAVKYKNFVPTELRVETIRRFEAITKRPLICYATQVDLVPGNAQSITPIGNEDLEGFDNLIDSVLEIPSNSEIDISKIDVLMVSNGGSPVAAERIVRLLRENFDEIRFIIPSNAYSAATMMALACDEILMTDVGTLGPIDPQINGIPARTILRGFEGLEERIKQEGPQALGAYIHLLGQYNLHLLEICRDAEALAKELAHTWLTDYMLKDEREKVDDIVNFLVNYDEHKSHARSIGRTKAKELGLNITFLKRKEPLTKIVRSLQDQFSFFFKVSSFFKLYENGHGVSWGRQMNMPIEHIQNTEGGLNSYQ